MNNCYDVMYVCRRFVPSSTGSPYPPSSRRGTLRYQHESTAKVAIFANLRKHLPVFSPFRPIVCAFSASFPSANLPFLTPLFPFLSPPCQILLKVRCPFFPKLLTSHLANRQLFVQISHQSARKRVKRADFAQKIVSLP